MDDNPVAILFADVCESTLLFERVGNEDGLRLIGACLDELAAIVRAAGGELIRSKGDDVLSTFASADEAFDAAVDMLNQISGGEVRIHAGLHVGSILRARGDIYGDAVNLAARLLDLANPGELLASERLQRQLSPRSAGRLKLIGRRSLEGVQQPVRLFSLLSNEASSAQVQTLVISASERPDTELRCTRLTLEFEHKVSVFEEGDVVTIGRAESCDCVVANPWVSRKHAGITIKSGVVTLTDASSSGTHVEIGDAGPVRLRRSSVGLTSEGRIYLGASPKEPDTPVVHYRIETYWALE